MRWADVVVYDETSPTCLRWKIDLPRHKFGTKSNPDKLAGDVAGYDGKYARIYALGTRAQAHRVIYEMFNGPIPDGMDVDHIDGNKRNNRVGNLRCVSRKLNLRNQRKFITNTSGVAGVSFSRNQWGSEGWRARWYDMEGKERSRTFTLAVHGAGAFDMAVKARKEAIDELNKLGAGYTDRHGL